MTLGEPTVTPTPEPPDRGHAPKRRLFLVFGVLLGIPGLAILVALASYRPGAGGVAAVTSESRTNLPVHASVDGTIIGVANAGPDPWSEVDLAIKSSSQGMEYTAHLPTLASGGGKTLDLREFVDADGRRFDPIAYKVSQLIVTATVRGQRRGNALLFPN